MPNPCGQINITGSKTKWEAYDLLGARFHWIPRQRLMREEISFEVCKQLWCSCMGSHIIHNSELTKEHYEYKGDEMVFMALEAQAFSCIQCMGKAKIRV